MIEAVAQQSFYPIASLVLLLVVLIASAILFSKQWSRTYDIPYVGQRGMSDFRGALLEIYRKVYSDHLNHCLSDSNV